MVRIDPSLDRTLCERRRYWIVEQNGAADALLPATDLDGSPHFDILEGLGPFVDLPVPVSTFAVNLAPTWDGLRRLAGKGGASM